MASTTAVPVPAPQGTYIVGPTLNNDGVNVGGPYNGTTFTPVRVNLEANISAAGTIDTLSVAAPEIYQLVDCSGHVHASSLFKDVSCGVFEFWEPSDATGDIVGAVSDALLSNDSNLDSYAQTRNGAPVDFRGHLITDFDDVLNKKMNASQAVPFKAYAAMTGARNEDFKYASFGHMMLAWAAHYAFGHVAATAAIDNDQALIERFNAHDEVTEQGAVEPNADAANIAPLLADAIHALSPAAASRIAREVIGQDAERAKDQDNNQLQNNVHQALRFIPGDIIYVRINMGQWEATVGATSTTGGLSTYGQGPSATGGGQNAAAAQLKARLPVYNANNVSAGETDRLPDDLSAEAPMGTFFTLQITLA